MRGESVIASQVCIGAASMSSPDMPEHLRSGELDWQTVDRALRGIARRRAALDADEARWLREAERLEIWRPLGMVSALDYLERVLGYAPRTAQERLRVARALGALPQLSRALAHGELAFSGVRELTRVATPATEAAWLRVAIGKNLRQIEELVADRRPGDRPDDLPDPSVRTHVVRFELSAETFARLRQARGVLDEEHGRSLDEDAFIAALCGAVLDGSSVSEPSGRARFQVAMTVCARCRQGWQEGAGVQVPVGAAAVERAMCDAQHIGTIDGDASQRAYQDVPPSVARRVWRRDGGRCRVPGCRSARGLELHHLVQRAHGGNHDASNIALVCSACHQAHHAGILTITGTADRIEVRRPENPPVAVDRAHVDAHTPGNAGDRAGWPIDRPWVPATCGPIDVPSANSHRDGAPACGGDTPSPVQSAATDMSAMTEPIPRGAATTSPSAAVAGAARSADHRVELATRARMTAETRGALRALGWSASVAQAATVAVATTISADAPIERWIRDALRHCPRPMPPAAPSSG